MSETQEPKGAWFPNKGARTGETKFVPAGTNVSPEGVQRMADTFAAQIPPEKRNDGLQTPDKK